MASAPRVYSIPAGAPFLEALAAGILARHGSDPLLLSRVTILLPTRRACRALAEAFLRQKDGDALLLPNIRPLGDVDEDELDLRGLNTDTRLPIPDLERALLLSRLLRASPLAAGDDANAYRLALGLADLLDTAATEEVGLDKLPDLVPAELAEHWRATLDFLRVIREHWPNIKAERAALDAAEHRRLTMQAWVDYWQSNLPADPVIAAGSTGTIPATAKLLHLVARLPQGAVVLPGLDAALSDAAWAEITDEPTHPQHTLAQLLGKIGVMRGEVQSWPEAEAPSARVALLREALLPPGETHRWRELPPLPDAAFAGLQRLEAPGPREEAMSIALALRETLEQPGRTAALITPDRGLARRVAAELQRYGISVDDTAGRALSETPPAVFLRLVVTAASSNFAPVDLLALLKHPFFALGKPRREILMWVRQLERTALRGTLAGSGLGAIAARLAKRDDLLPLLEAFRQAMAPLLAALAADAPTLPQLTQALVRSAEILAAPPADETPPLWQREAGETLHGLVLSILEQGGALGTLYAEAWPRIFEALLEGHVVRPRYGSHPRLSILGLLEARLVHADRVVLGGLNEGTWPPQSKEDAWLSRPMRATLGLPPPERRLGQTAHDFVQAAARADVIFSRATKVDGTPTVPARWLLRLEARLGDDPRWPATLAPRYLDWAAALDRPAKFLNPEPPRPMPPLNARPRSLSVTDIELWVRDPYALYARRILKLPVLKELAEPADARLRGDAIHRALDAFLKRHAKTLPDDKAALAELLALGRAEFEPWMNQADVAVLWWPRFTRAMSWFLTYERERRARGFLPALLEQDGALTLTGDFILRARADRIDRHKGGALAILDYKTGQPPSEKQVYAGLSPQLALEAAIAKAGGFKDLAAGPIAELVYIRLHGGETAGEERRVESGPKARDPIPPADELADQALERLVKWVAKFDDPATPYLSRPRPQFIDYAGDYDHLARAAERSLQGDEG
jgi:ATP-dependent helicase/nuclease subunit B